LVFKKWLSLQEVGTSTGDVAGFKRISIPLIRRVWPWNVEDPFFKKKNKNEEYLPRSDEEEREIEQVLRTPRDIKILDDQYNFMRILIQYPLKSILVRIPRKDKSFYQHKMIAKNMFNKGQYEKLAKWLRKGCSEGDFECHAK